MEKFQTITSSCVPLNIENVDTDQIIPARFLKATSREGFGDNLFRDWRYDNENKPKPNFVLNNPAYSGKILVAAKNFGCGSSREQATAALKYSGFGGVIASSFARIFFRNSLNLGLPLISSQDAYKMIKEGDELEIDLMKGIITNKTSNTQIVASPLDEKAVLYLKEGGLIPYLRKKYAKK